MSTFKYILVGVAVAWFLYAWKQGQLLKLASYFGETREELRKCTWPSVDELKGSTVVVAISIVLLGAFTVGVDLVISFVLGLINGA